MIVSVDELKAHLRVQHNEEDALLYSLLSQAEAAALDYCHVAGFGDAAPEPVRLAVMLFASHFYENRDSSDKSAYDTMMMAFHALLYPYRDPEKMF